MVKPHPAEGGKPTDLSRPCAERAFPEADYDRCSRALRAYAVAWRIRERGSRLTSAQLTALEEVLR